MTTSELFRRDPQKGKKEFSAHKGFTLIELMVVIAVIAIITSLALPSYRMIIEKRQVTSGAEQIKAFLSAAQLEAVKRNDYVAVAYGVNGAYDPSDDNDYKWCFGMTVVTDAANPTEVEACDCTLDAGEENACTVDSVLRVYRSANLSYQDVLVEDSLGAGEFFVYEPIRGFMANLGGSMDFNLVSDSGHYDLGVTVSATGRVGVCSNEGSEGHIVPGYDPC